MRVETLFLVFTYGLFPAWALLMFAPRWKWTQKLVHSVFIPVVLALAHIGFLLLAASPPEGASAATLEGAMRLFQEPWTALVCWIHYLAFDLFVGAWEVRDAIRRKIPHLAVIPCVLLTWMYGPLGLLMYVIVRFISRRVSTLEEVPETAKASALPAAETPASGNLVNV
ncbi:ABA4-like family protein [Archangium lipolyticum]|uniref:ABA4-like family protein n=1 Tax=Archangium lipolyticum TaxID=2970465 RepID=UPI00214A318B|nr:ABA4-like family protein [Archangium lipolyticum]